MIEPHQPGRRDLDLAGDRQLSHHVLPCAHIVAFIVDSEQIGVAARQPLGRIDE